MYPQFFEGKNHFPDAASTISPIAWGRVSYIFQRYLHISNYNKLELSVPISHSESLSITPNKHPIDVWRMCTDRGREPFTCVLCLVKAFVLSAENYLRMILKCFGFPNHFVNLIESLHVLNKIPEQFLMTTGGNTDVYSLQHSSF